MLSYFTGGLAYGHYSTTVTEAGRRSRAGVLHRERHEGRLHHRQRRRGFARRQLDRQDRVSVCRPRQAEPQLRAARHAAGADDPHPRQHLPRRPELSHRRQRELQSAAGQLDRLLPRRQRRLAARPQPELALGCRPGRNLPSGAGRLRRRRHRAATTGRLPRGCSASKPTSRAPSSEDKDACIIGCAAGTAATFKQTLPWFGTVRGRVGYTLGSTLFYGTGGFAYGQTETKITETAAGVGTGGVTIKRNRGGYAVGAGIETPVRAVRTDRARTGPRNRSICSSTSARRRTASPCSQLRRPSPPGRRSTSSAPASTISSTRPVLRSTDRQKVHDIEKPGLAPGFLLAHDAAGAPSMARATTTSPGTGTPLSSRVDTRAACSWSQARLLQRFADISRTVRVAQAGAEDDAVAVMGLERAGEQTIGRQHARDFGQAAARDPTDRRPNRPRRSDRRRPSASPRKRLHHVGNFKAIIEVQLPRLLDHAGRQIVADDLSRRAGKGARRKPGAAAEIDGAAELLLAALASPAPP